MAQARRFSGRQGTFKLAIRNVQIPVNFKSRKVADHFNYYINKRSRCFIILSWSE